MACLLCSGYSLVLHARDINGIQSVPSGASMRPDGFSVRGMALHRSIYVCQIQHPSPGMKRLGPTKSGGPGFLCGAGTLLLAACSGLYAQSPARCQGPAALENALTQHPTAAVYDALGAHFASENRFGCAIPAFESAVRLDPASWQGHYNLGVALFSAGKTP